MAKYNAELKPGDVLLARPHGAVSRVISWFSGPFSHAAQVLIFSGRTWVIDANPPAVRLIPLSSWLRLYGAVTVRRPIVPLGENVMEILIEEHLIPQVGIREYAESTIARLALRIPLGWLPKNESTAPLAPVICSELVSQTAVECWGFDPAPERADRWTTPSDLNVSEKYFMVTDRLEIING